MNYYTIKAKTLKELQMKAAEAKRDNWRPDGGPDLLKEGKKGKVPLYYQGMKK